MATPIVLQLQDLASDSKTSVSDLLRKARLVAVKLKLGDINSWIEHEMHGYPSNEVPRYRRLKGDLRADNPVNYRAIPVRLPPNVHEDVCIVSVKDPVGTIENLLQGRSEDFRYNFRESQIGAIRDLFPEHEDWLIPYLRVTPSQIYQILDAVRSKIFDWSLDLEQKGIVGDGMQFSSKEVATAATITNYNINGNVQGIVGHVQHSHVDLNLQQTVTAGDLASLRTALQNAGIAGSDLDELEAAVRAEPQVSNRKLGPRVAQWLGKVTSSVVSGGYQLATGVSTEVIAKLILAYYGIAG